MRENANVKIQTFQSKSTMNSLGISKMIPIVVAVVVVGAIIGVVFLMPFGPAPTVSPAQNLPDDLEPTVTFILTGLDNTWVLNGGENPTLDVPVGSVVEIVLENDDTRAHNFAIDDFGIRTRRLAVNEGDRLTLIFIVEEVGTFTYRCPLHPNIMDGEIVVSS